MDEQLIGSQFSSDMMAEEDDEDELVDLLADLAAGSEAADSSAFAPQIANRENVVDDAPNFSDDDDSSDSTKDMFSPTALKAVDVINPPVAAHLSQQEVRLTPEEIVEFQASHLASQKSSSSSSKSQSTPSTSSRLQDKPLVTPLLQTTPLSTQQRLTSSRSQRPIDTPLLPAEQQHGTTALFSQLLITPLASQRLSTPLASQRLSTPLASQRPSTPLASQHLSTPLASQRPSTPVAFQQLSTPLALQRLSTPLASQRLSTPLASQRLSTPLASLGRGTPPSSLRPRRTTVARLFASIVDPDTDIVDTDEEEEEDERETMEMSQIVWDTLDEPSENAESLQAAGGSNTGGLNSSLWGAEEDDADFLKQLEW